MSNMVEKLENEERKYKSFYRLEKRFNEYWVEGSPCFHVSDSPTPYVVKAVVPGKFLT